MEDDVLLDKKGEGNDSVADSINSIEGSILRRIFSLAQDTSLTAHLKFLFLSFMCQIAVFLLIIILITISFQVAFNSLSTMVNLMSFTTYFYVPLNKALQSQASYQVFQDGLSFSQVGSEFDKFLLSQFNETYFLFSEKFIDF